MANSIFVPGCVVEDVTKDQELHGKKTYLYTTPKSCALNNQFTLQSNNIPCMLGGKPHNITLQKNHIINNTKVPALTRMEDNGCIFYGTYVEIS